MQNKINLYYCILWNSRLVVVHFVRFYHEQQYNTK